MLIIIMYMYYFRSYKSFSRTTIRVRPRKTKVPSVSGVGDGQSHLVVKMSRMFLRYFVMLYVCKILEFVRLYN